jgi:hypothetical protein
MKRITTILLLASGVAVGATGVALADGDGGDNGMNRQTGDAWTPSNNPQAARGSQSATAAAPTPTPKATAPARTDHATIDANKRIHPTSPFHDDTGA